MNLKKLTYGPDQPIKASEGLRVSPMLSQLILDNAHDLVAIHKLGDLSYEYVNPATIDVLGFSQEELFAKSALELVHPDDIGRVMKSLKENLLQGRGQDEFRCLKKDGSYAWLEVTGRILPREKDEAALIIIACDITSRKIAESALRRQMEAQALLLDISRKITSVNTEDIDVMIDTALRMIGEFDNSDRSYVLLLSDDQYTVGNTYEWCAEGVSSVTENLQGLPVQVLPWWNMSMQNLDYVCIPRVDDLPPEAQSEKEVLQAHSVQSLIVIPLFMEDKIIGFLGFDSVRSERQWSKENVVMLESAAQIMVGSWQRRKFAQSLQHSENYYRTIFENTGAATLIIDQDMTITMANEECQRLLGCAREELLGATWTDFIAADSAKTMREYHCKRRLDNAADPAKYKVQIKDSHGNYKDGLVALDIIAGTDKSVATIVDNTEFNRIDRALQTVSAVNMAMIQAEDEMDLLRNVCRKIIAVGRYKLAWVGYIQVEQTQKVWPAAYAGTNGAYLAKLNISLQDPKRGRGPVGNAIRTGQPMVVRDLKKDDTFKPWLKDALRRGFKSCMALPLLADNMVLGVLSIYADETDVFDTQEQKLLLDMANNLAYAIVSMRARTEKKQTAQALQMSLEKMQRILMQAVTSLGTALGIRDPFTADHQKKVVSLATAIADEMGLSREQIEGISVAGNLHDIGKMSVPVEILSKPGKLSDMEFAYIKTHSQAGYEIVKDIEFPWPVAEIILQHHERIDGSGYPRGLAGEETLIEARIMAVADVVEAMASHRPYRAALGIEMALEEICRHSGVLYDPAAVNACMKLFKEKGFNWE